MQQMLESARHVLGEAGQIAPVTDTTARVTYTGGGFRMLDCGGFTDGEDPRRIDSWVRQMLRDDQGLVLPEGLWPVLARAADVDPALLSVEVGAGLVQLVHLDGSPVRAEQATHWETTADVVARHARTELARAGISAETVEVDGHRIAVVSDTGAASWALFANLLKSVTGENSRQVVFLVDADTCIVVPETNPAALPAAARVAQERGAGELLHPEPLIAGATLTVKENQ